MRSLQWKVAAAVLMCAMAGCRSTALSGSKLVGTWLVDVSSEESGEAVPSRIVLQADGTFQATALPSDLADDPELVHGKPLSGAGTWTYERNGGTQQVDLLFQTLEGADKSELPYKAELQVEPHAFSARLFFNSGDPDEDERVTFHKQSMLDRS